jgi:hypothetical protein
MFFLYSLLTAQQLNLKYQSADLDAETEPRLPVFASVGRRRICLRSGTNRSLYPLIRRMIKQAVVIIQAYHLLNTYKILFNILLSRLTPHAEEIIGGHQCGFRHNRSATYAF